MQNETVGWVKSILETRNGALLGLVMIGPHVTDMVEAGVIALDAGATAGTVADGIAPHPTLSEAIKGASLAALGRAIDLPNRKHMQAAEATAPS
jgi:dihydrolipoamide dehydrogenase